MDKKVENLIEAIREMFANAEFADGQGVILTHDAEAVELALADVLGAR